MKRLLSLLLVTFSALILELALIRWVAGQVRIVAYFPNLVLIAAFFGMGLGCLRQGKKSLFWLMPTGLLVIVILSWIGSRIAFTGKASSEYFWLLYYNLPEDAPVVNNLFLPLWVLFVATTIIFIPLGQMVASILRHCQRQNQTLLGYSFDLGGSLLGVIVFTLLSFERTFPIVWFTVALLPGIFLLGKNYKRQFIYLMVSAAILLVVQRAEYANVYSPYYALSYNTPEGDVRPESIPVSTNGSLHQIMVDVSTEKESTNPKVNEVREGFNRPFQYLEFFPENALVLGAGTGNDVAVLLDYGVRNIDAVEIDPEILKIGKQLHPNSPYASSGVNVFTGDARSFLNNTLNKYDLIIFGTLDSMTRLSALSNVRLDNFVYTMESIKAAKSILSDRGGLILHFMVGEDFIDDKIIGLVAENFKEFPIIHDKRNSLFNRSFLVGPAFSHVDQSERAALHGLYKEFSTEHKLELPTDDWPYLYLPRRQIGSFYVWMLGIIFLTAMAMLYLATFDNRKKGHFWRSMDIPMFLFGAAFLVLNTKSVTEIGLLWGNTWMTNSLTFASILFVLLLSTLFFNYRPLPLPVCFAGLSISLIILYLFPLSVMLGLPLAFKLLCTTGFIGLPFFFAGACFAGVFKSSEDVSTALGWNVIGALCGGLLEYINMLLGFKSLYLIALVFYLAAFILFSRRSNSTEQEKL